MFAPLIDDGDSGRRDWRSSPAHQHEMEPRTSDDYCRRREGVIATP